MLIYPQVCKDDKRRKNTQQLLDAIKEASTEGLAHAHGWSRSTRQVKAPCTWIHAQKYTQLHANTHAQGAANAVLELP